MRNIRAWIAASCILAPILLLGWIIRYGVDVPFWDEWSFAKWLVQERHTPADFFAQMNESRTVVPKIIFLTVAKIFGYHPKAYMCVGWLLTVSIALLVYFECYVQPNRKWAQDLQGCICLLATSLVMFSPAAYENWLWGIQWVIFIPLLCLLLAYQLQRCVRSYALRCGGTVLLNLVATFSFSNGMVVWMLSFPYWKELIHLVFGRRPTPRRFRSLIAWSAVYFFCSAAALFVYFSGYQQMPAHPSLAFALERPWIAVKYFAAWSAGPFSSGYSVASGIGMGFVIIGVMLAMLLGFGHYLRKEMPARRALLVRRLYPSLLLVAYACASGLMTTLGRAGLGVEYANSSRYLFHSGTLIVGIIAALNTFRMDATVSGMGQSRRWARRAMLALLVLVLAFSFRNWRFGLRMFEFTESTRRQTLLTVRMLPLIPDGPAVEKVCPWLNLNALVSALEKKGFYSAPPLWDWVLDELKHPRRENGGIVELTYVCPTEMPWLTHSAAVRALGGGGANASSKFGEQGFGELVGHRSVDRNVVALRESEPIRVSIGGWSFIPDTKKPADCVLVCRRGETGGMRPWSLLPVWFRKDDVAEKKTGYKSLGKCGFAGELQLERNETLGGRIEFFSVDEREHRLFPLSIVFPLCPTR
ncbi:MAG: hypothetical protein ABI318_07080 [Chthoniobacteraceae bacterium]